MFIYVSHNGGVYYVKNYFLCLLFYPLLLSSTTPVMRNHYLQLTNNNTDDEIPSLHNGDIAWHRWDGNDYEIYDTTLIPKSCPDIKVNGAHGPLFVHPGKSVNVSVSLYPNGCEEEVCDWWIGALTTFGTDWYKPKQG